MLTFVASCAKCNQILGYIVPEMAPPSDVMNLQVFHRTAILTTPAVALENLSTEILVRRWRKAYSRLLSPQSGHVVLSTPPKNSSFCVFGSKWKSRDRESSKMFESVSCKFAPARKSAQIISKQ